MVEVRKIVNKNVNKSKKKCKQKAVYSISFSEKVLGLLEINGTTKFVVDKTKKSRQQVMNAINTL